jgi:hypothetical protein
MGETGAENWMLFDIDKEMDERRLLSRHLNQTDW